MSLKVASMVWRARLDSTVKLVAVRLADFADDDGCRIFPSNGRVARECGLSERAVRDAYRKLEGMGVLVLVAMERPGQHLPREYRFDLAVVASLDHDEKDHTKTRGHDVPGGTERRAAADTGRQDVPDQGAPVAPDPLDNPSKASAERAEERRQIVSVGMRVLKIMGVADDPRWTGSYGRVSQWLADGADPDLDIFPTIERVMARRGGQGPPRGGLTYFDGPISDAIAARTKPMPKGNPNDRPRQDQDRTDRGGGYRGADPGARRRAIMRVVAGGVEPGGAAACEAGVAVAGTDGRG